MPLGGQRFFFCADVSLTHGPCRPAADTEDLLYCRVTFILVGSVPGAKRRRGVREGQRRARARISSRIPDGETGEARRLESSGLSRCSPNSPALGEVG